MNIRHPLLLLTLLPVLCSARVWRVEQDGSGEFTNIQLAVDVASPRDTVLVGPGRYDTLWLFNPAYNWEVVVGVSVDSLTIIGTDRDVVIVGPDSPYPILHDSNAEQRIYSKGIVSDLNVSWMVIENMSFEYTDVGVQVYPSGEIRNCIARNTHDAGFLFDKSIRVLIENCLSDNSEGDGINISSYGTGQVVAIVRNCHTSGSQVGYYISHPNAIIENCESVGCNTGFGILGGSSVVRNVISDGCYCGISAIHAEISLLTNAVVRNSLYWDISVYSNGILHGNHVILNGGGDGHTIFVGDGYLSLHESHIMPRDDASVYIEYHNGPDDAIDLTGNYWGTTSADSIASWIWDSHDDPSILTTVRYEPFSPVPVPNETRSMGDVKAMFRR